MNGARQLATFAVTLLGLLMLTFFIGRVMPVDPVTAVVGIEADTETYQACLSASSVSTSRSMCSSGAIISTVASRRFRQRAADRPAGARRHRAGLSGDGRTRDRRDHRRRRPRHSARACGPPRRAVDWLDHLIRFITLIGYATPVFWIAMICLLIFYALARLGRRQRPRGDLLRGHGDASHGLHADQFRVAGDWDVFWSALNHLILPATVLGYHSMAYITRMTRSFMLEQLSQEYIVTARVKGLSRRDVFWRHAFRNIRVQLVTIVALAYGGLLEGAVLVETVFAWPGFGQYLTSNLLVGDMNAAMGCVLIVGIIFIALNLISDCSTAYSIRGPADDADLPIRPNAGPNADSRSARRRCSRQAALREIRVGCRTPAAQSARGDRPCHHPVLIVVAMLRAADRRIRSDRAGPRQRAAATEPRPLVRHRRIRPRHLQPHRLRLAHHPLYRRAGRRSRCRRSVCWSARSPAISAAGSTRC